MAYLVSRSSQFGQQQAFLSGREYFIPMGACRRKRVSLNALPETTLLTLSLVDGGPELAGDRSSSAIIFIV